MNELLLHSDSLKIGYPGKPLLICDHLEVRTGQLIVLIGRNGAGKTSLLRTLMGLLEPLSGGIYSGEQELSRLSPRDRAMTVAACFSRLGNMPVAMRVHELIGIGRHPYSGWLGWRTAADQKVILESAEMIGIAHLLMRELGTLSDGEAQKASLARTLAQESKLILLDEPLAFLDFPSRVELLRSLKALCSTGRTVIFSSHDLAVSLEHANTAWVLNDDGKLVSREAREIRQLVHDDGIFRLTDS